MLGVGIGMVPVIVAMTVIVIVVVVMMTVSAVPARARADAFDVVVMTLLSQADLGLEAENLIAVFAQLAVHPVLTDANLTRRNRSSTF